MNYEHFENLWEACEKITSETEPYHTVRSLIMILDAELGLYKNADTNDKLSITERQQVKEQLFGRLLLTLTQLSQKDNINTFVALQQALQFQAENKI